MSTEDPDGEKSGGYRNPPRSGRFRKGVSANPAGRPKGSKRHPPYDDILGQLVTVTENGKKRQVPAHEAFQLRLFELAISGHNAATGAIETLREEGRIMRSSAVLENRRTSIHFVSPGNVTMALEPLKMGRILDRYRPENARVVLEPWIVDAALARFGDKRLTVEEQAIVLAATRTPKKVAWPDWWEVLPE